jgi:Glycosyl transferases group 1
VFVHLYPFHPSRLDGGLLRLNTALAATAGLGPTCLLWYDAKDRRWRDEDPNAVPADAAGATTRTLKRRLFPSTLFESGRHAVAALADGAWRRHVRSDAIVVLHTTYLAPALDRIRPLATSFVDVYDLIWRTHAIDSSGARSRALRLLRGGYARSVRRREQRALRRASGLPVAGYADFELLRQLGVPSAWCPTGLSGSTARVARVPGTPLRIGFLGNFFHQPTVASAEELMASPAAGDRRIEVVLGGWGSEAMRSCERAGARLVGPVETTEAFWHSVDCAVIPVTSGSGMKCKLGEALLAGRPVVTTALGAEGFAPAVRAAFVELGSLEECDADTCLAAVDAGVVPSAATVLRAPEATARYRAFIESVLGPPVGSSLTIKGTT